LEITNLESFEKSRFSIGRIGTIKDEVGHYWNLRDQHVLYTTNKINN
jgi:hypothetical protein